MTPQTGCRGLENAGSMMVDFQQMSAFVEDALVLERGDGCSVWDTAGRKYLDGRAGVMAASFGHGHVFQYMEHLAGCVCEQKGGGASLSPAIDGAKSVAVGEAIQQSVRAGAAPVSVRHGF